MKIAYFSPLPPTRSGIADYSAGLLPYLGRQAEITLFVDDPDQVAEPLPSQFPLRPLSEYPRQQWQYDLPLYQMGNNAHHETIYQMSLRYPGVVVLHEIALHQFIAHRTIGRENPSGYSRELGYAEGLAGINHYWHSRIGQVPNDFSERPLTKRLLDTCLGMIVHSQFVRSQLLANEIESPVAVIPHWAVAQSNQTVERADLDLAENHIIFASLGQITPQKQIPYILQTLSALKKVHQDIFFLIVGEDVDGELGKLIEENGWQRWVKHTGYIADLHQFEKWLSVSDVVINLRQPTIGETSGVALRALGAGKPLLVFDHGWYREIPDEAALKVPVMDEDGLRTAVTQLATSPALRQKMGAAGKRYIQTTCAPKIVAEAYQAFLRQIMDQYRVRYA